MTNQANIPPVLPDTTLPGEQNHASRTGGPGRTPSGGNRASRDVTLDIMKILAIYGVLLAHALAQLFDGSKEHPDHIWLLGYGLFSSIMFVVPVFMMCSGAVFLSGTKNMPPLDFYRKRLPKIVFPLLFWSFFYYVYKFGPEHLLSIDFYLKFLKLFLTAKIIGSFWFLYMLVGVYLSAPFLQNLLSATPRSQQWLFVVLSLGGPGFIELLEPVLTLHIGFEYSIFGTFIGYFVLGHLLHTSEQVNRFEKCALFLLYLATVLITFKCQWYVHQLDDRYQFIFLDNPLPNVIIMSVAVFMLLRSIHFPINDAWRARISTVSRATYGIYLVHMLSRFLLKIGILGFPLVATDFPPLAGIFILGTAMFLVSLAIVLVLAKIPGLRKLVGY